MKVLAATRQTRGWRDNDFSWTVEGELVFITPLECGRGFIDDDCGCRRSMAGLVSERATTTVKVVERDLDRDVYLMLIRDGLEKQGYLPEELVDDPEVMEWVEKLTETLLNVAGRFPTGTVLERRGELVVRRWSPEDPPGCKL